MRTSPRTPTPPPSLRLAAVLSALFVTISAATPAVAAPGDDLSDALSEARREASRIASEVEDLGATASIVLEEYRVAAADLDVATSEVLEARRSLREAEDRVDAARTAARDHIVAIYQGKTTPNPLTFTEARDVSDLASRRHYAEVVARTDRELVRRLASVGRRLADEERRLEIRREEHAEQVAALDHRRDEVETAMAERERALARAEGDLADLVAEEQRRRAAAEAARARELARRRAAAVPDGLPTTTSSLPEPLAGALPEADDPAQEPASAPAGLPPVHPGADAAVEAARSKIGTPYQWGGNGPDSYDCSGLTTFAWSTVGVALPRSSGMQQRALPPVPLEHIRPGDLLFFGSPVHHVGIYAGDGTMVNAPYTGTTVRVDSIWRSDFAGAGRPG